MDRLKRIRLTGEQDAGAIFTTLVSALILVAVALWVRNTRKHKRATELSPPGPWGLPLLGYLPFLRRKQHIFFRDLSRKYGPVLSVRLGAVNVVILNSYQSIREGFSKKQLLARTSNIVLEQAGVSGLLTLNGKPWIDNRKYCVQAINSPASGQRDMEAQVQAEIGYLAEKISETKGRPIPVEQYLLPSVSNNASALVFGHRYEFDDPKRKMLDGILGDSMRCLAAGALITFVPRGLRTLSTLYFTRFGALKELVRKLKQFVCHEQVLEDVHRESRERNFIDGYLRLISEHKEDPDTSFNMPNLVGNVLTVFAAASQTTHITVLWSLLNMADKADTVQRKVQEEIDRVTRCSRAAAWSDRHDMPYTMATVWEMYRWRTVVLMGVPREADEDVIVQGYLIPSGTVVMANLWAVHMDPDLWEAPEEFRPERFLSKDGSRLIDKPDWLVPFSVGKRMCPAENLANLEVFLYLTRLLQKFTVLPEDGTTIDLNYDTEGFCIPKSQRLRFIPRNGSIKPKAPNRVQEEVPSRPNENGAVY
ncbi:cytochrome P450 2J4 [Ixodes scapularis]|uniref:cytochrome P450 2J4 n=1 Tax=Ixodes scapularis TaxID=6945 RepID=UPI001A9F4168|nr:cytochrome P450 2J4 [Ixodes scapularis]